VTDDAVGSVIFTVTTSEMPIPLARCSVTIAARTASRGELTRLVCSTANNRRFVLSSIGKDEA
jgi:hypothetical protein